MKMIIVLAAVLAMAVAKKDAVITADDSDNIGVDGHSYGFHTSDGISAQGNLQNAGSNDEFISVQGSFQYVGADRPTYTVKYTADKNGFQPQGAHLPFSFGG